jgi:hypothetical protein
VCNPGSAFKEYERSAARRGLSLNITLGQFRAITAQPCLFCGESWRPRGIDRWNSEIGYELDNCRPCCGACNMFKGRRDGISFADRCQLIGEHVREARLLPASAEPAKDAVSWQGF